MPGPISFDPFVINSFKIILILNRDQNRIQGHETMILSDLYLYF